MSTKFLSLYASLLALTLSSPAHGALLLLDNMDYGAGTIGSSVGDWVDGSNRLNYQGGVNVTFSGDSDYVNDPANTGTGSLERNANIDDRFYTRDFTDAGASGEVWLSSTILFTGGGDSTGDVAGISLNNTGGLTAAGDVLGVGFDGTNYRSVWFDDSAGSSTYDSSATISNPTTLLLLVKLNIGAGADSFSMWMLDSASSFGTTEASLGAAHLSSAAADFGDTLDHIQVGGIQGMQSNFDQIRISDLGGDNGLQEVLTGTAIPEPSAALLGGLGALLLLRRHRA